MGHCELDRNAERSYRALFDTKGEWYCEDIRNAEPEQLPEFDLLCGGFPCQSFSVAGHRGGFSDPRGTLFFELARLAEARKPAYLLFENVPGLLYLYHTRGTGEDQGGGGWNKQPLTFLLYSSQYVLRRKHSVWISKRLPGSTPVPRMIRLLHLTRNEVKKLEKAAQSAR